ncbi:hypothetical protein ACINK0_11480 [Deinococcus sp. VB343]|uniref:hypothetical protein n=1 Tax=Deinococcus sp. VB343 TaxID=3385567 RepID=UPI0039C9EFFE
MKVDEFWALVREKMKTQPRGYQTRIAQELGVEKSYISRFVKGDHELAPKYQQAVLDSLGIEMDVKEKQ